MKRSDPEPVGGMAVRIGNIRRFLRFARRDRARSAPCSSLFLPVTSEKTGGLEYPLQLGIAAITVALGKELINGGRKEAGSIFDVNRERIRSEQGDNRRRRKELEIRLLRRAALSFHMSPLP
jgi:hypothetical protein